MSKSHDASVAARRQAQELLSKQQELERNAARDKLRQAEDAKTARLKALRLAKEAAEAAGKAAHATGKPALGAAARRGRRAVYDPTE